VFCILQQKHIDEVIDASSKFSKATEEKLIQKMETSLKNREDQLKQLMNRLRDHVSYHDVSSQNFVRKYSSG